MLHHRATDLDTCVQNQDRVLIGDPLVAPVSVSDLTSVTVTGSGLQLTWNDRGTSRTQTIPKGCTIVFPRHPDPQPVQMVGQPVSLDDPPTPVGPAYLPVDQITAAALV